MGRAEYDPYGNLIGNTIPLELTDRLFTGQIWEADLGLYNYRARFYDPMTGSFIQPDSIVPDPLDPRAWNRFGYVYGNPANFVDPSGHIPTLLIAAGIGALIGGGIGAGYAYHEGYTPSTAEFWQITGTGAVIGAGFGTLAWANTAVALYGFWGGVSGGVGNVAGQIINQTVVEGKSLSEAISAINWIDVGVGIGIGALLGGLTPIPGLGTSRWGAFTLGALGNSTQYVVSQYLNNRRISGFELIYVAITGGALGAALGKVRGLEDIHDYVRRTPYHLQATQIGDITLSSLGRGFASATVANVNFLGAFEIDKRLEETGYWKFLEGVRRKFLPWGR